MRQFNKRLVAALVTGMVLGIFCIIGIGLRIGYSGNEMFLISAWVNRIVTVSYTHLTLPTN